jgi:hypothetical protein
MLSYHHASERVRRQDCATVPVWAEYPADADRLMPATDPERAWTPRHFPRGVKGLSNVRTRPASTGFVKWWSNPLSSAC